ncbi:hypothetical protein AB0I28_21775 [Phytomonospora sp. NPDC050363]|uniref:hypothetical protein n=1 Tax=Phytomonospora sp. NPDC050363 TaxID=3155642 RepID=UPI0033F57D1B
MGIVTERVERMNIKVASPDGSVRATLAFRGLSVRIKPGTAELHNERSLTVQVEAVLASAFTGYERAVEMIRSEVAGGRRPPNLEDLPEEHPRRRLDAEASRLTVTAYSAEDYVSLTWRGKKDFTVELRPGTVRRLTEGELAEELNSALADAARQRAVRLREIHRRLSGATRG